MRALWGFAQLEQSFAMAGLGFLKSSGLFAIKVGITCPACGGNFRVMQTRIHVVRAILWLTLFSTAAIVGEWGRHAGSWADRKLITGIIAAAVFGLFMVQRFLSPYLATVRPPLSNEVLSYPLKSAYRGSDAEHHLP
jgi:hypothetical protein